jgi:hypothetical protein
VTQQEAMELVRRLLKAQDEEELQRLVAANLGQIDGTFFGTVEAAAQQLERESKPQIAVALRQLAGRMLSMKTLI